ncbi:CehA/McbA family metallohydrolase [Thermoproteota archaeon]
MFNVKLGMRVWLFQVILLVFVILGFTNPASACSANMEPCSYFDTTYTDECCSGVCADFLCMPDITSFCGDGVCNGAETEFLCPSDCIACASDCECSSDGNGLCILGACRDNSMKACTFSPECDCGTCTDGYCVRNGATNIINGGPCWLNSHCESYECENSICVECGSHDSKICYDDDVYWTDSCDNMQERKEDCSDNDYTDNTGPYCKVEGADQYTCNNTISYYHACDPITMDPTELASCEVALDVSNENCFWCEFGCSDGVCQGNQCGNGECQANENETTCAIDCLDRPDIFDDQFIRVDVPWRIEPGKDIPVLLFINTEENDLSDGATIEFFDIFVDTDQDESNNQSEDQLVHRDITNFAIFSFDNFNTHKPGQWYEIFYLNRTLLGSGEVYLHTNTRIITDGSMYEQHNHFRINLSDYSLPQLDNWYSGDTHVHTSYTDNGADIEGWDLFKEMGNPINATKEAAKAIGLDWMIITDHSFDLDEQSWAVQKEEISNTSSNELKVFQGEEISCYLPLAGCYAHMNKYVHMLGFGHEDLIEGGEWEDGTPDRNSIHECITEIESQEGLAFAAHPMHKDITPVDTQIISDLLIALGVGMPSPFNDTPEYCYFPFRLEYPVQYLKYLDGWQIWNYNTYIDEINDGDDTLQRGLVALENSSHNYTHGYQNNPNFIIGGSDAHGEFNSAFGKVRTYAYSPNGNNEEGILNAINRGSSFITDGPLIYFTLDSQGNSHWLGETIFPAPGSTVNISINWESNQEIGKIDEVKIFKDGILFDTLNPSADADPLNDYSKTNYTYPTMFTGDTYYRIEVISEKGYRGITNPIFLKLGAKLIINITNKDDDILNVSYTLDKSMPSDVQIAPNQSSISDLIYEDEGMHSLNIRWKDPDLDSERDVTISKIFAENQSSQFQFIIPSNTFDLNNLLLTVDRPAQVIPGQEVKFYITVEDNLGNILTGADVYVRKPEWPPGVNMLIGQTNDHGTAEYISDPIPTSPETFIFSSFGRNISVVVTPTSNFSKLSDEIDYVFQYNVEGAIMDPAYHFSYMAHDYVNVRLPTDDKDIYHALLDTAALIGSVPGAFETAKTNLLGKAANANMEKSMENIINRIKALKVFKDMGTMVGPFARYYMLEIKAAEFINRTNEHIKQRNGDSLSEVRSLILEKDYEEFNYRSVNDISREIDTQKDILLFRLENRQIPEGFDYAKTIERVRYIGSAFYDQGTSASKRPFIFSPKNDAVHYIEMPMHYEAYTNVVDAIDEHQINREWGLWVKLSATAATIVCGGAAIIGTGGAALPLCGIPLAMMSGSSFVLNYYTEGYQASLEDTLNEIYLASGNAFPNDVTTSREVALDLIDWLDEETQNPTISGLDMSIEIVDIDVKDPYESFNPATNLSQHIFEHEIKVQVNNNGSVDAEFYIVVQNYLDKNNLGLEPSGPPAVLGPFTADARTRKTVSDYVGGIYDTQIVDQIPDQYGQWWEVFIVYGKSSSGFYPMLSGPVPLWTKIPKMSTMTIYDIHSPCDLNQCAQTVVSEEYKGSLNMNLYLDDWEEEWDIPLDHLQSYESDFLLFYQGSDVDIHIYDSQGNHAGLDYNTGEFENEIPGITYTGSKSYPEMMRMKNPQDNLTIKVVGVNGTGPESFSLIVNSLADLTDADNDTIPDYYEIKYGLNTSIDDSNIDIDGDGLTNYQEYMSDTNPLFNDTDFGGEMDGAEVFAQRNPLDFNDDVTDRDEDSYNSTIDCDDLNPDVYPGAVEICSNGIDDDCDGNDMPCPDNFLDIQLLDYPMQVLKNQIFNFTIQVTCNNPSGCEDVIAALDPENNEEDEKDDGKDDDKDNHDNIGGK